MDNKVLSTSVDFYISSKVYIEFPPKIVGAFCQTFPGSKKMDPAFLELNLPQND